MDCRTDLSYHHQMRFRNEAVEKLTEWLTSHKDKKSSSFTDLLTQAPQIPSLLTHYVIITWIGIKYCQSFEVLEPIQPPRSKLSFITMLTFQLLKF